MGNGVGAESLFFAWLRGFSL